MDYSKENRLSYTERARHIVDSLTLEERVSLMSGSMSFEEVRGAIKKKTREHYNHFPYPAGGIPEKGIPAVLFCDGPRGVVCGNGKSTCFPVSMLRGASFDTDLEEEIGEAWQRRYWPTEGICLPAYVSIFPTIPDGEEARKHTAKTPSIWARWAPPLCGAYRKRASLRVSSILPSIKWKMPVSK